MGTLVGMSNEAMTFSCSLIIFMISALDLMNLFIIIIHINIFYSFILLAGIIICEILEYFIIARDKRIDFVIKLYLYINFEKYIGI